MAAATQSPWSEPLRIWPNPSGLLWDRIPSPAVRSISATRSGPIIPVVSTASVHPKAQPRPQGSFGSGGVLFGVGRRIISGPVPRRFSPRPPRFLAAESASFAVTWNRVDTSFCPMKQPAHFELSSTEVQTRGSNRPHCGTSLGAGQGSGGFFNLGRLVRSRDWSGPYHARLLAQLRDIKARGASPDIRSCKSLVGSGTGRAL